MKYHLTWLWSTTNNITCSSQLFTKDISVTSDQKVFLAKYTQQILWYLIWIFYTYTYHFMYSWSTFSNNYTSFFIARWTTLRSRRLSWVLIMCIAIQCWCCILFNFVWARMITVLPGQVSRKNNSSCMYYRKVVFNYFWN